MNGELDRLKRIFPLLEMSWLIQKSCRPQSWPVYTHPGPGTTLQSPYASHFRGHEHHQFTIHRSTQYFDRASAPFTIHDSPSLFRPRAGEHDGNGEPEDFEIEPEGPVIDVFEIEADPIAKVGNVIASADLP